MRNEPPESAVQKSVFAAEAPHDRLHSDAGILGNADTVESDIGVIDASIPTTERGIWAIKWSFLILAATAALQLCDTLGVALGTGVAGAILAAGATLEWTIGSALTLAFVLSAAVALATSFAAVRLPEMIHQHDA